MSIVLCAKLVNQKRYINRLLSRWKREMRQKKNRMYLYTFIYLMYSIYRYGEREKGRERNNGGYTNKK